MCDNHEYVAICVRCMLTLVFFKVLKCCFEVDLLELHQHSLISDLIFFFVAVFFGEVRASDQLIEVFTKVQNTGRRKTKRKLQKKTYRTFLQLPVH